MTELEQYMQFSEMLERNCFGLWRTVIGRDDEDAILQVNSVLFTKNIDEELGKWAFSFALRRGERWFQERVDVEPFAYDPMDTNGEMQLSPQNMASSSALELVEGAVRKMRSR